MIKTFVNLSKNIFNNTVVVCVSCPCKVW